MKIHIETSGNEEEPTIHIRCKKIDATIEKIISFLNALDLKLTGQKDGQTYLLDANEVLYAEVVDKHTFLYTETAYYDTAHKLYELEYLLQPYNFFRINKSSIVNLTWIRSLKNDIDGKILIQLKNGEKLFISRQYALQIKKKLGVVK